MRNHAFFVLILLVAPVLGQTSKTSEHEDGANSCELPQRGADPAHTPRMTICFRNGPHVVEVNGHKYQASLLRFHLTTELSSRGAKVGKPVVAVSDSAAKLPDGTIIPKGAKLRGTVDNAMARGHGEKNAALAFLFTEIQIEGGTWQPVIARLVAAYHPYIAYAGASPGLGNGVPGPGGSASFRDSNKPYIVMPDVGPGALLSINDDLDLSDGTLLYLLVTKAAPEAPRP